MKLSFKNQFIKNWTSLLLFGFFLSASVSAQKPNTDAIERKWLDVPYAKASRAQKLDIYLPDEGNGPFPVIVSIHGGAFKSGDKADNQLTPMLEGLKRGYAVVSINYRLTNSIKIKLQHGVVLREATFQPCSEHREVCWNWKIYRWVIQRSQAVFRRLSIGLVQPIF